MNDQELIAYLKLQGLDKDVAAADRIEELVKERDDYKDLYYAGFKDAASLNIHYAEVGYKAKTAEANLAKAVEMLRETTQMLSQCTFTVMRMKGQYFDRQEVVDKACTVLAELEGQ